MKLIEKPKILFVEEVSGLGGSTTCLSHLTKGLLHKGYDCKLILYFRNPEIEQRLFPGLLIYHLDKWFNPFLITYLTDRKSLPKLTQLVKIARWSAAFLIESLRRVVLTYWIIKRCKVDIVHTNNSLGINMFSVFAARLARTPCMCHIRGYESFGRFQKKALDAATAIITISNEIKSSLCNDPSLRGAKISVTPATVYDGLTEEELTYDYAACDRFRQQYGISSGTTLIGMVGMLTEWKGFHIFLEAAGVVLARRDDVAFFIIGDAIRQEETAYKESLLSLVKNLGIEKHVHFTGLIMDARSAYASLDIVVHASLAPEPFGRVVIEAMAASKPVIAANAGGPAEIISNGENGLLFQSGDPRDLAQHLLTLLDDSELCSRIGRAARRYVETKFRMDMAVNQVEQAYDRMLHEVISARGN